MAHPSSDAEDLIVSNANPKSKFRFLGDLQMYLSKAEATLATLFAQVAVFAVSISESKFRFPVELKMYLSKDAVTGAPLATLFAQVALFAASLCLRETKLCSTYDHSGIKAAILYHICSVLLCYTNRCSRLRFFRLTCGVKVNSIANIIFSVLGILLEEFYEKSLASLYFGLSLKILLLILVVIIQPSTDLGSIGFLIGATGSVAHNLFQLKLGTWIVVAICFVLYYFKCWLDENWLKMDLQENGNNFLLPAYLTEKISSSLNNRFLAPAIQSIDALMVSGFYVVWAWAFLSTNCLNSKSCASCSAMEKLKCGAIYVLWLSSAYIHGVYSLFQVESLAHIYRGYSSIEVESGLLMVKRVERRDGPILQFPLNANSEILPSACRQHGGSAMLPARDENGTTWTFICENKNGEIYFTGGWGVFSKRKHIRLGDWIALYKDQDGQYNIRVK